MKEWKIENRGETSTHTEEKGSDTEYSVFIKKLYLLRVQSSEDRTYIYRVIPIYKYPH